MTESKSNVEKDDLEYILVQAAKEFETLANSTVLFTGANGFLGYYFIKSILAWNNAHPDKTITLLALDIFNRGIPKWLTKKSNLKIIKKDITKFSPAINQNFDFIIHAASIASPIFYRQYPIETINANVKGLYNILEYTVKKSKTKNPVKGLLFFSSSEIYGDPTEENIPTPETYRGNVSCTGPRACYDESKRFGETLCVNFSKVYGLPIKIVRPFNNYGPGLKITDGRVIPDFAKNILTNKNITLLSQGSPTRTFCYITDAVIGYLKALIRGGSAESYNIGVEKEEISMYELAEKMKKLAFEKFGYSGKIIREKSKDKNYLTDSPNRRCPDISKARRDLGFNPQIGLDKGLSNILTWYREDS
ncbi:NAD-dependent dehydratase [Candidatus Daviesbacteria bacterium RIFCSPHIGHO2_02_FULL_41_10]|uniref:NAD-dependent dehydratase n=1 Tax=Candidatus Daviesbacteria bacterium RIFCSPHIGHO2_02_FULL_41_10 TaxID=1797774 RepID=A0A1F5JUM6_9BACT|nr:MAG: NAD-dependent dehydratase [Candidatus Daviesbacteria bacterium RIFCSPHIGHO2_02_FULL_41_10]